MPLGAFRINSISKPAVSTAPVTQSLTSLSAINYNNVYEDKVSFLGYDSQNRPVFARGYVENGTYYPKIIVYRVNSDMTITTATTTVVSSAAVLCVIASEKDHAGDKVRYGSENYLYIQYHNGGYATHNIVAASYNLDTLALTLGSPLAVALTAYGGAMAYVGNRQCIIAGNGGNNGNQLVVSVVTRTQSSTTLSQSLTPLPLAYYGQAGGHIMKGYPNGKFILTSQINNGHENNLIVGQWDGSTIRCERATIMDSPTYNVTPWNTKMNNTNKLLATSWGQYNSISTLRFQAVTAGWNANNLSPAHSEGSVALTTISSPNGSFGVCDGTVDNEMILLYRNANDSNKLQYQKITVNEETVSQGSIVDFNSNVQSGVAWQWTSHNPVRTVDMPGTRTTRTVTFNGNAVPAAPNNTSGRAKINGYAWSFDGADDYVTVAGSNTAGSGAFTIEAWIYYKTLPTNSNSNYAMFYVIGSNDYINMYSTNKIQLAIGGKYGSFTLPSSGVFELNTWAHVAVVRNAGDYKVYWNGVDCGTAVDDSGWASRSGTLDWTPSSFQFGRFIDIRGSLHGYIDEVRVSKSARYTANFTPPNMRFNSDDNTLFLCHGDNYDDNSTEAMLTVHMRHPSTGDLSVLNAKLEKSTPTNQTNTLRRLEQVATATSTLSTITVPAAAAPGDFAILFDTSTTTTDTNPAGWTSVNKATTTGIRSNISWKKLVAADINTSITGMGGTTSKTILVFRANASWSTATFSVVNSVATTAAPAQQTITMVGQTAPMIGFAHYASTGAVGTRGLSIEGSQQFSTETVGGATRQYVKYVQFQAGDSDTQNANITMSDSGTNTLQSFRVSFT